MKIAAVWTDLVSRIITFIPPPLENVISVSNFYDKSQIMLLGSLAYKGIGESDSVFLT